MHAINPLMQGLKLCFLTQNVQLGCVMWSSKMQWRFLTEMLSLSWNRGKNEQICTVKFQNPHTGEGLQRPSPDPTPSALRRFAPPCLARGLRLLHRPSLCAVDILRYFRPCFNAHIKTAKQQYGDWYTGRWWLGCNIWYTEDLPGRTWAPPSPLLAVPNITAHLSTASVPAYLIWCGTIIASGL